MDTSISAFFNLVLNDPALRDQLIFAKGQGRFVQHAVIIARDCGFEFTEDDLREALELVEVLKRAA